MPISANFGTLQAKRGVPSCWLLLQGGALRAYVVVELDARVPVRSRLDEDGAAVLKI